MSWLQQQVGADWYKIIEPIVKSDEFKKSWLAIGSSNFYPDKENIFRCFRECPVDKLRIVLIGQDVYPNGEGTGLCFDTNGKKTTPSLRQMLLAYDKEFPSHFNTHFMEGKLEVWAKRGVLMYNTALTVERGKAGSHLHLWEYFTTELFKKLNDFDKPLCFIAWGKNAQKLVANISNKHLVLTASHPASAVYNGGTWDSNNNFQDAEKFVKEKYNESFEW